MNCGPVWRLIANLNVWPTVLIDIIIEFTISNTETLFIGSETSDVFLSIARVNLEHLLSHDSKNLQSACCKQVRFVSVDCFRKLTFNNPENSDLILIDKSKNTLFVIGDSRRSFRFRYRHTTFEQIFGGVNYNAISCLNMSEILKDVVKVPKVPAKVHAKAPTKALVKEYLNWELRHITYIPDSYALETQDRRVETKYGYTDRVAIKLHGSYSNHIVIFGFCGLSHDSTSEGRPQTKRQKLRSFSCSLDHIQIYDLDANCWTTLREKNKLDYCSSGTNNIVADPLTNTIYLIGKVELDARSIRTFRPELYLIYSSSCASIRGLAHFEPDTIWMNETGLSLVRERVDPITIYIPMLGGILIAGGCVLHFEESVSTIELCIMSKCFELPWLLPPVVGSCKSFHLFDEHILIVLFVSGPGYVVDLNKHYCPGENELVRRYLPLEWIQIPGIDYVDEAAVVFATA